MIGLALLAGVIAALLICAVYVVAKFLPQVIGYMLETPIVFAVIIFWIVLTIAVYKWCVRHVP